MEEAAPFIKMIENFQCPGCMVGGDTECGKFKFDDNMNNCQNHYPGTILAGAGPMLKIVLGLPHMFNIVGCQKPFAIRFEKSFAEERANSAEFPPAPRNFRLYKYLTQDGYCLVKRAAPRINEYSVVAFPCTEQEFEQVEALHTITDEYIKGI